MEWLFNKWIRAYDTAMPPKDPGVILYKGEITIEPQEICDDYLKILQKEGIENIEIRYYMIFNGPIDPDTKVHIKDLFFTKWDLVFIKKDGEEQLFFEFKDDLLKHKSGRKIGIRTFVLSVIKKKYHIRNIYYEIDKWLDFETIPTYGDEKKEEKE